MNLAIITIGIDICFDRKRNADISAYVTPPPQSVGIRGLYCSVSSNVFGNGAWPEQHCSIIEEKFKNEIKIPIDNHDKDFFVPMNIDHHRMTFFFQIFFTIKSSFWHKNDPILFDCMMKHNLNIKNEKNQHELINRNCDKKYFLFVAVGHLAENI
ncbi:hypothetical protein DERP_012323 [Dermatophagoides pteronyssinus]|uniref:Uncharacterized protein n=1 Tax=Dermatophagoides pteronyssinus TaxID=6956 RepID=A0ABQ8JQF0_DERPT|nr:hypothetical protein DERP_012323 [Dermatophagoides pteronyssinus]